MHLLFGHKYNQSSYQVVNLTEICVDSECLTQNWVNNLGIWATLVRLVADAIWLAYPYNRDTILESQRKYI